MEQNNFIGCSFHKLYLHSVQVYIPISHTSISCLTI